MAEPCPACHAPASAATLWSRLRGTTRIRRKECRSCGDRWTTIETIYEPKNDGGYGLRQARKRAQEGTTKP